MYYTQSQKCDAPTCHNVQDFGLSQSEDRFLPPRHVQWILYRYATGPDNSRNNKTTLFKNSYQKLSGYERKW